MNDSAESLGAQGGGPRWLLLIHQLPPHPAYIRVKIRRRLARLHALPLKNTVYVLPYSEEAVEDFQWIRREIEAEGGEAVVCAATLLEGQSETDLTTRLGGGRTGRGAAARSTERPDVSGGRVWVTRRGVGVDRMASAWLIRQFIDPRARFKFVPARGYRSARRELRFDMFDAEFTHEGDRCTFEVLLGVFGLRDPALTALAELVHDIDCKDDKFGRPERAGLERLIQGVMSQEEKDSKRLALGAELFQALYQSFKRR